MTIRVLIADDHAIVRQGLRQILADTPDLLLAGEAENGAEMLRQVREGHWDVLLLDINMPFKNGIDTLKKIREEYPNLPVLILSMHPEEQYALRLLRAGAAGYMNKESAPEELVNAIRRVAQGKKYVSPAVAELLAEDIGNDAQEVPHAQLSDREFQVLLAISSGMALSEIAVSMALSVKTVSTYRTRIMEKMHMKSNADLIHYAIKNGLVG